MKLAEMRQQLREAIELRLRGPFIEEHRACTRFVEVNGELLYELLGAVEPHAKAFGDIVAERARQDAKRGVQHHTPEWWLPILVEEVGEVAKALLESTFQPTTDLRMAARMQYRKELVGVAAVAVAAIECLDCGLHNATPMQDPQ